MATKISASDGERLTAACGREGMTKSTFLRRALLAALDQLDGRGRDVDVDLVAAADVDVDLVAADDADAEQAALRCTTT